MDNNLKKFTILSGVLVLLFFLLITVLGYIYRYFTIHIYNTILLFFISLLFCINVFIILAVISVVFAYRKKYVIKPLVGLTKFSLKILIPFVTFIYGFTRKNKDIIRKLYIDVNNILVQSDNRKFLPEEVLIVVPHCLQQSDCTYKITRDVNNCRQCGRCSIGEIKKAACDAGIRVAVVTGGTAARQIVKETKPRLILSVACERDLASGIADIKTIPVIGIINKRPNGPCFNTNVDVELLKLKITDVIEFKSKSLFIKEEFKDERV